MVIEWKAKVGTCTIVQSNPSEIVVVVVRIIVSLMARGVASWQVLAVLLTMNRFNDIYPRFEKEMQQVIG